MNPEVAAQYLPITNPTWIFFLVLCVILFAPMLLERLHIPHIIGMVLAGVLIGPYGLNILARDSSFEIFGHVGLLYIMFLAGLGMDVAGLKKYLSQSLRFGLLTFSIPFAAGIALAYFGLHYSLPAALLLGCIFSSHTLVSYPIVGRYGLTRHLSVTISVGATMVALTAALFVLAGISGAAVARGNSIAFWLWLVMKFFVFCIGITLLLPIIIRAFFRNFSDSVLQFVFVLAMSTLSAGISEWLGLQGIFGAFLAGVVFNRYIPSVSPLMNRINFVGNALFIPYFLIGVGMLINVHLLYQHPSELLAVLLVVVVATAAKGFAAWAGKRAFGLDKKSGMMMFGLTEAHAAGALAMVMVGIGLQVAPGQYLMNDAVFNDVVMLILFSCIISSLATNRAARLIVSADVSREEKVPDDNVTLISISNPDTIEPLVQMALLMRNTRSNKPLIAVHVVIDSDNSPRGQAAGVKMLEAATHIAAAADVRMKSGIRVSTNVASALIHSAKEYNVSTLMVGLHRRRSLLDSFYGQMSESLVKAMNRQICMIRCFIPANTISHIYVAVPVKAELEVGFGHWLGCLARLAGQLGCRITFCSAEVTNGQIAGQMQQKYADVRAEYEAMPSWSDLSKLAQVLDYDNLLVIVMARRGSISYQTAFEHLPALVERNFSNNSIMILYPEQAGVDSKEPNSFHTGLNDEDAGVNLRLHTWMEDRSES